MNLLAPSSGMVFQTPYGTVSSDTNGLISTTNNALIAALLQAGCIELPFNPVANPRDFVDCGDFSVNPFQRNIPGIQTGANYLSGVSSTPTYFADRFSAVGGASSNITQTLVADATLAGYNQCLKVSRTSGNTNTAPIYLQHVIESMDSYRAQGQNMVLSFYAKAGANYSGGALGIQVAYGTGINQSALLLNQTGWTGQANVYLGATGANSIPALTTSWQRFQIPVGAIPTTATQLGLQWFFTPTGTAGADDSVSFQDVQFEIGTQASPCERLDAQFTIEIAQRFAWIIPEPANGVLVAAGTTLGANSQNFYMATPVQFIKAPTVTLAAGSFKVAVGAAYAAATTLTAGTTHTVNAINVTAANTAAAGIGALLGGGGGSGWISASADF